MPATCVACYMYSRLVWTCLWSSVSLCYGDFPPPSHPGKIVDVAVSADGMLLCTTADDKSLKVFDVINFGEVIFKARWERVVWCELTSLPCKGYKAGVALWDGKCPTEASSGVDACWEYALLLCVISTIANFSENYNVIGFEIQTYLIHFPKFLLHCT